MRTCESEWLRLTQFVAPLDPLYQQRPGTQPLPWSAVAAQLTRACDAPDRARPAARSPARSRGRGPPS